MHMKKGKWFTLAALLWVGHKLALVAVLWAIVSCGKGSPTGPTIREPIEEPIILLPPTEPAWRLDKTDALNYYLGHRPEDKKWGFGAVIWEGNENSGRFTYNTNPGAWQHFRWDSESIYLVEDWNYTGPDRDRFTPTSWSDFRLAPRHPSGMGKVDSPDNKITFWEYGCTGGLTNRYPIYIDYTFTNELRTSFRVGGSPFYELAFLDWERGWYRWEYWKDGASEARYTAGWLGAQSGPEPVWGERCTQ
jgi:hypothetical protein